MKNYSGIFITLEGTEGSGKSSLLQALAPLLKEQGVRNITLTREPGGSPVAEGIRNILLHQDMDPRTELFLYQAARAEHLARTVVPALKKGHWVLCDRYTDSTLAYQSMARGLDWNEVRELNAIATEGLVPKLTILLDQDPAKTLKHATDANRFERESLAFHRRVRAGYLKAAKQEPKRWHIVPARSAPVEVMAAELAQYLLKRFGRKKSKARSR